MKQRRKKSNKKGITILCRKGGEQEQVTDDACVCIFVNVMRACVWDESIRLCAKVAQKLRCLEFASGNLIHGVNEIVGDAWRYHRVVLVVRVIHHKMTQISSTRHQLATRTLADQRQVAGELASCLDINVGAVKVVVDQWDETWEAIFLHNECEFKGSRIH